MKKLLTISLSLCAAIILNAQKKQPKNTIRKIAERPAVGTIDSLIPGRPAFNASTIDYTKNNKSILKISFGEPVVVSVATKPEKWGYFQFPKIGRMPDQSIHIRWRLNDDAMEAYGNHKAGEAISKDGGKTYQVVTQEQEPFTDLVLPGGDRLAINTPKPIPASELKLPEVIGGSMDTYSKSTTQYYRLHDLPE